MDIKELIDSGARCIDGRKGVARMIDLICMVLAALALSYAAIFYLLTQEKRILIPALVEAAIFLTIRILSKRGYTIFAAFALIVINNAAVFYFSATLGIMVEAHMLVFFFIGSTLLFFQTRKHRIIAFTITLATLVCCEINFYNEWFTPLVRTHENQFIVRWLALPWVILLDTFLLYLYVRSRDLMLADLKRLNSHTSHELKTPLNAIMLILEDVKAKHKTEISSQQLYDLISAATQCKLNLENDLISSKIEAGYAPKMAYDAVRIRSVIEGALDLNAYIAKAFGVNLVWHWGTMPEWLSTDENKITKILNNLVTNALKFTPRGKTVTVEMGCDGDYWQIVVTDQGPGIPRENLGKIFKHYFTDGGVIAGTGLGLPITSELVKSLGGTISVKTSVIGSCFTVSMPLIQADGVSCRPGDAVVIIGGEGQKESSPLDHYSVLLVEDDEATQKYLGKLLLRMGATVSMVGNAKKVVDHAARFTPDIILLDLNTCNELSGIDSIRVLAMCYPHAKIVAVSGDKEALDEAALICFAALEKPLVPSQLLRVARSFALENSRVAIP